MTQRPPIRALSLALACALSVAIYGCHSDPTVPKLGEQPISLTLSVSTQTLQFGQADTIRVEATNNLQRSVGLNFVSDCTIVVTIRNAAGTVIIPPNGRAGCLPVATRLNWATGGVQSRVFVWKAGDDFDPPGSTAIVAAGTYFVSAQMNGIEYSTFAPSFKVEVVP